MNAEPALDKRSVAESFSRAAVSYDKVAHLQRKVADAVLQRFPWKDAYADSDFLAGRTIVDLGCGTGYVLPSLQQLSPTSTVVGMDLAPGMISFARHKSPTSPFVIADMDALPLRPEACALVYSSLAVQWSSNLAGVLDSVYRTLVPGGLFMFSTLLDGTLKELAQAWRAADNYQHVNAFTTAAALTSALAGSGFEDSNVQYQQVVLQYSDVRELTGELKKLGAHNSNRQRSQGMTGKAALRAFKLAYESCQENGLLPATYEVAYVYLRKSR